MTLEEFKKELNVDIYEADDIETWKFWIEVPNTNENLIFIVSFVKKEINLETLDKLEKTTFTKMVKKINERIGYDKNR